MGDSSGGVAFSTLAWLESLRFFHYNREYMVVHSHECHALRPGDWHEEPHPTQLEFAVRQYAESERSVVVTTFLESGHQEFSRHRCPIKTLCEEIADGWNIRLYYREVKPARRVFHAPVAPKKEDAVDELVEETDWLEVQVFDQDDRPVAGVEYLVKLTDGKSRKGTTNSGGILCFEGIPSGDCSVELLSVDEQAWAIAGT